MTATAAVRARLIQITAVTALVPADRITTQVSSQSAPLPRIRLERVASFDEGHLRGTKSIRRARVQVSAIATKLETAQAIADAIYGDAAGSALSGWQGQAGAASVHAILPEDERADFEGGETPAHRVFRDYIVWMR